MKKPEPAAGLRYLNRAICAVQGSNRKLAVPSCSNFLESLPIYMKIPLERKGKAGNFRWRRCPGGHAHQAWGFVIAYRTVSYFEMHLVSEKIRNYVCIRTRYGHGR
ncbi:hypothetical protein [Ammoniphilus sp. YIM 78166]|uniref:hypothetical protein n=1 Tax=Ammoniphilus sp. YIM 78166 TaxID=1644106 RepID=UPI001431C446|nr:hypothetical protein [Ammoniphilus sp. YIM 78166]